MNYPSHAAAAIFPMMSVKEFEELCAHIREYGLIDPIVLCDGKIVDGRNRYKACVETGVEPRFIEWSGTGSLVQWVIGKNLKRRHLDSGQKAAAAVLAMPLLSEEARKRQQASGGDRKSEDYQKSVSEKIHQPIEGRKAAEEAAKLTGTNSHYVYDAMKIQKESPRVFSQMQRGEISLQDAKAKVREMQGREPVESINWKSEYWKLREQVDVIVTSLDPDELQQAIVRTEALLKAKSLPR